MHARSYAFNIGRFMSVDPVRGKVGSSQSWNRYSYVDGNPLRFFDPDGRGLLDATTGIDIYLALLKVRALVDGYVHGGLEAANAPSVDLGTPTGEALTEEYSVGSAIGAWSARHPTVPVVEAKVGVTLKGGPFGGIDAVAGFSLVNFNDPYFVFGAGVSRSFSRNLRIGIAASLLFGTVLNYRGPTSFQGKFTSSSAGAFPLGFSVAGNPADSSQPSAFTLDLTNSVGLSETEMYYVPLAKRLDMDDATAASTVMRCNGAYHFVDQCQ